ncbi:tol-pal system-associated acyl-CoA thioesterase [Uliginosibacterium flavum]|uniref:Tol-pal system-associated acyl-CoA thioesterase n=1 Tax=Uliginosibacterium flavum TaxID=1396831 RepID=A0ABV2TPF1_9RHOO
MSTIHNTGAARQSVWPVRVYYEDTDAGGVVYYANYLRFCERARTERLRALGVDQPQLLAEQNIVFVVSRVEADYLKGAELDDALSVISTVISIGAATLRFQQRVMRGEERLFEGLFTIACVDWKRRRAVRIPDALRSIFESDA